MKGQRMTGNGQRLVFETGVGKISTLFCLFVSTHKLKE